jgi:CubicO group peptidase (beta-lactamase class C family)
VTGLPNWQSAGEPLRVLRAPGASFGYSGEGYVYLQRVVEHLVGEPLEGYMQRAVLALLGMAASSYVWLPRYDEAAARGHHTTGEPVETWKPQEANAASSLHTTPLDYARFLVAMTVPDRGRAALDEAGIRAMVTPQIHLNPLVTS